MRIVILIFSLFTFYSVTAGGDKDEVGGFYSKIDSLVIVDDAVKASFQINLYREEFKKKFSEQQLQVYNYYLNSHLFRLEQEYDSAHVALLNALEAAGEYRLEDEGMIYVLEDLAILNIQINNTTVGKQYIEKIRDYVGVIAYAEEAHLNTFYIYAFQKQDTLLLKQAYREQVEYYSNTEDSLSVWFAESNLSRLDNEYEEAVVKLKKILEQDTLYRTIVLYELISSYDEINNKDSILKYTELYLPYIDNAPTSIQRHILRLIIDHKVSLGDTLNLRELQAKFLSANNPLADGMLISNIAKREVDQLKIKTKEKGLWGIYSFIFLISLSCIFSVWYYLNKKLKKQTSSLSPTKPSISKNKEEEIKDQVEAFIAGKGFLDPSISQTKIVEDFNLGNVKYLSQTIKKEYGKKFPVFIKDLRIDYLKENFEKEFRDLKKNEIATKLGFGSYRTFKDYVEQSNGISLNEFLRKLEE